MIFEIFVVQKMTDAKTMLGTINTLLSSNPHKWQYGRKSDDQRNSKFGIITHLYPEYVSQSTETRPQVSSHFQAQDLNYILYKVSKKSVLIMLKCSKGLGVNESKLNL